MDIGNHFLASLVLKSRYEMRPAALHDDIAIIQTNDCIEWSALRLETVMEVEIYLYSKQKEVEVEVVPAYNILIRNRHQYRAAAVCEDRYQRAIHYRLHRGLLLHGGRSGS